MLVVIFAPRKKTQFFASRCFDFGSWKPVGSLFWRCLPRLLTEPRFILANTEQLHERITLLSDRVRQLEDGLQTLQASCSNEQHPLLAPDLLRIKNSQLRQSPTTEAHSRDDAPRNPVDFSNAHRKPEDYSMDVSTVILCT